MLLHVKLYTTARKRLYFKVFEIFKKHIDSVSIFTDYLIVLVDTQKISQVCPQLYYYRTSEFIIRNSNDGE